MLGLAVRIQEIAMMTPGMIMRPSVIMPISFASGVLVRSTAHAKNVPQKKAQKLDKNAK